jgi:hypothetical protein
MVVVVTLMAAVPVVMIMWHDEEIQLQDDHYTTPIVTSVRSQTNTNHRFRTFFSFVFLSYSSVNPFNYW